MAFMSVLMAFAALGFLFFVFCAGIVCLITAVVLSIICLHEKKKKGACGKVKKFFMIAFWIVSSICLSPLLAMAIMSLF